MCHPGSPTGLRHSVQALLSESRTQEAREIQRKSGLSQVQEEMHVTGMLKNHKLAQAVSDSNFGEIRRQLEYKAPWQGSHVVVIDRFYPSSKTCSGCGSLKPELSLRERVYECSACGLTIDRDLNAAINLRTVAVGFTDTRNACGERSSDLLNGGSETALVEAGTKQENVA